VALVGLVSIQVFYFFINRFEHLTTRRVITLGCFG
jgi:hypothetical protein